MPGTGLAFVSSSTGNIVRFDDSVVPDLYFTGAGGAWNMTDTNATTTGSFIISNTVTVTLPSGNLGVGGSFTNASGTVTHNTSDLYMTSAGASSITARGLSLHCERLVRVQSLSLILQLPSEMMLRSLLVRSSRRPTHFQWADD